MSSIVCITCTISWARKVAEPSDTAAVHRFHSQLTGWLNWCPDKGFGDGWWVSRASSDGATGHVILRIYPYGALYGTPGARGDRSGSGNGEVYTLQVDVTLTEACKVHIPFKGMWPGKGLNQPLMRYNFAQFATTYIQYTRHHKYVHQCNVLGGDPHLDGQFACDDDVAWQRRDIQCDVLRAGRQYRRSRLHAPVVNRLDSPPSG